MNNDWLLIQKYFIEDYWESFLIKLELRKTDEECRSLFLFEISLMEQKLKEYLRVLEPELYTDHKLIVNDQKFIINQLSSLYKDFKNDENYKKAAKYKWPKDGKEKLIPSDWPIE